MPKMVHLRCSVLSVRTEIQRWVLDRSVVSSVKVCTIQYNLDWITNNNNNNGNNNGKGTTRKMETYGVHLRDWWRTREERYRDGG
jgi:hypothetical protein